MINYSLTFNLDVVYSFITHFFDFDIRHTLILGILLGHYIPDSLKTVDLLEFRLFGTHIYQSKYY